MVLGIGAHPAVAWLVDSEVALTTASCATTGVPPRCPAWWPSGTAPRGTSPRSAATNDSSTGPARGSRLRSRPRPCCPEVRRPSARCGRRTSGPMCTAGGSSSPAIATWPTRSRSRPAPWRRALPGRLPPRRRTGGCSRSRPAPEVHVRPSPPRPHFGTPVRRSTLMTVTESHNPSQSLPESLLPTLAGRSYSDPDIFAMEQAPSSKRCGSVRSAPATSQARRVPHRAGRSGEHPDHPLPKRGGACLLQRVPASRRPALHRGRRGGQARVPVPVPRLDLRPRRQAGRSPEPHQDARRRPRRFRPAQGPRERVARLCLGLPGRGPAVVASP